METLRHMLKTGACFMALTKCFFVKKRHTMESTALKKSRRSTNPRQVYPRKRNGNIVESLRL